MGAKYWWVDPKRDKRSVSQDLSGLCAGRRHGQPGGERNHSRCRGCAVGGYTTKAIELAVTLRGIVTDNAGGLNGSSQHLLKVFWQASTSLISFARVNSNKTKALFRF